MTQVGTKRDFVRVTNRFNVRIVARDQASRQGTHTLRTSQSINVSASGLLVTADEPIDIGAVVNITFMKPNTFDFFRGTGRVVRVNKNGGGTYTVAVTFIDLSSHEMEMLDYYLHLE